LNSSDILINGAKRFNVSLNKDQVRLFLEYLEILRLWNKKINLTSIKDENETIIKHFIDSL
jgi:16S rRNA (guanine527-N7)-methyltransferase